MCQSKLKKYLKSRSKISQNWRNISNRGQKSVKTEEISQIAGPSGPFLDPLEISLPNLLKSPSLKFSLNHPCDLKGKNIHPCWETAPHFVSSFLVSPLHCHVMTSTKNSIFVTNVTFWWYKTLKLKKGHLLVSFVHCADMFRAESSPRPAAVP